MNQVTQVSERSHLGCLLSTALVWRCCWEEGDSRAWS